MKVLGIREDIPLKDNYHWLNGTISGALAANYNAWNFGWGIGDLVHGRGRPVDLFLVKVGLPLLKKKVISTCPACFLFLPSSSRRSSPLRST
jgi:hypothetical protein